MRLAGRLLNLHQGEAAIAWLMFGYAFLAMTAYNIVKPITRSRFISDLGADNLPYVQLAAALVIGVLMYLYDRLILRLPPRWGVPVTQSTLALAVLGFWLLFLGGVTWASAAFYIFSLLMGVLLISQFWTVANDVFDPRQARRLFGLIGGGASLGGAMGAGITRVAVDHLGTDNLLPVSAATLVVCAALTAGVLARAPSSSGVPAAAEPPSSEPGPSALALLVRSRHLRLIALLIGCASIGAAIIEQQLNMAASGAGESLDEVTRILADVTIYLSLAGFIVQVGIASRLRGSVGLILALLLLPAGLGATAIVILLNGALWAPVAARVLDTSLRYSVDKTTREVLFLPLPADLKHRAKPFVDVTMDRIARALGAIALLAMIKPWGFGLGWQQLSYASLLLAAGWTTLAVVARREYLQAFRRSIGARELEPAALRSEAADTETLDALVADLSKADAMAVVYAIDVLDRLGHATLVTPALFGHASPEVRARAVAVVGANAGPDRRDAALSAVRPLLADPDALVRAAALGAAVLLETDAGASVTRRFLEDAASGVSVAAAVELADSNDPDDVGAAEAALTRLIADPRPLAAPARRDAAVALGRIRHHAFRTMLVPLLHDPDPEVARAAIEAVGARGALDPLFVPALLSRLGDRALKQAARDTLVGYGDQVIDVLAHVMHDPHEHVWVRRHVPATLARMPTPRSMAALVAALDERDGFLRYKAIVAIDTIRRSRPHLHLDPAVVGAEIVRETSRYLGHLTLRHNVVSAAPRSTATLLGRALDDKLARTLDRMFRLLGLAYGWTDVAAARYSLEHGDARSRAGALEYLDHLLRGDVRRRVMPILDTASADEIVRHANRVLKTRPRDLADTLAQLVHDDDPVVSASAIHFVVREKRQAEFSDDIGFVLARREIDRVAHDAATWALGRSGRTAGEHGGRPRWPAVEVAGALSAIPVFASASIDELFRLADVGHIRFWRKGQPLFEEGAPADDVLFLLEGRVDYPAGAPSADAPVALHLAESLTGRPLPRSGVAAAPTTALALDRSTFVSMISESVVMAQGLFRQWLGSSHALDPVDPATGAAASPVVAPGPRSYDLEGSIEAQEVVRLLRGTRPFREASIEHLRALVRATRDLPLAAGDVLWGADVEPAVYHLLVGEVRLEGADGSDVRIGPGGTIGLSATLSGVVPDRRAVVLAGGRALRLDRDALFEVLADTDDLMRVVLAAAFDAGADARQSASPPHGTPGGAS